MKLVDVKIAMKFDANVCQDFVVDSNKFKSEILICKGNQKANSKSIMGVISLMLKTGDVCILSVKGSDEEAAAAELSKFKYFDKI